MSLDPAWIALIGTLCGGIGLNITEHYLGRNKVKIDDASRIRDELRIEITSQREEINRLEADRDKWRYDYYTLKEEFFKLQTQLTLALEDIKKAQRPPTDGPAK